MEILKLDPNHTYFTSDTHFGHQNIIKFCDRPFVNTDEMDNKLIENWNDVVGKDDVVFHLGDFCFGGSNKWKYVREQLNGKIYLIKGNHDIKNYQNSYRYMFEDVNFQMYIRIEDVSIYLNHFPFLCYGGTYNNNHEVWQLFGHVHSYEGSRGKDKDRLNYLFSKQYDVGVDNNNYTPISFIEVKNKIEENKKNI